MVKKLELNKREVCQTTNIDHSRVWYNEVEIKFVAHLRKNTPEVIGRGTSVRKFGQVSLKLRTSKRIHKYLRILSNIREYLGIIENIYYLEKVENI